MVPVHRDRKHDNDRRTGDDEQRQQCDQFISRHAHLPEASCSNRAMAGWKVSSTGRGYKPNHSSVTTISATTRPSRGTRSAIRQSCVFGPWKARCTSRNA